ncbi:MAG: DUF1565 domain-containing protein, partial [Candidatus Krumholzibacteriota bacterium]|nr:DUF1565 domain-containing protein [Candidatus Krumholzibacteriota bacterium]
FDGWSDGEQSACRIIEVTGAASYEANYAHEFELTVATDPPDLVEIPGAGWYPAVAEVVLAAPEEAGGLTFSHWTVDGSAPMYESTIPVTMDAPHDAVAYYTDVVENTISGRVADTGDAPIEGVHMTGFLEDVFTDADGLYSGAVASGWEGTIEPVLDCWEFTPPSITYPPVDQDLADQDYVGTRLTYTISGRVADGGGSPLEGVQLVGLCGDMYTEPDGTYSCQVDCGWSGTVTPQLAGWSFTPPSRTYDDVHEDWSDQDYEGGTAEPIHVSNAGSDQTGDGSPGNPYATISHALSVSAYGDVVQVACGTYPEHELQMTTGVTLRGNPDDPGCVVVDAEQQGRVIECLECDDATLVTGITFTGGLVSSGSYPDNSGAGVYVFGGAPRFDHCIFTGNDAKAAGGVLCDQGADATFDHCLFHGNIVETQGGGIGVLRASQVAMQSCTVAGNTSTAATNANGGVYAYSNGAHIDLYECIVAFNTGIGVMCWNETGTITLHDSDVYGNTGGDWVNCIAGQEANPCNMSADPLFCDAAVGDYALDAASPCLPANNDCGVQMGAFGEGCGGVQYVIISGTVTDQDGGPLHPVLLHGFPEGEVFTDAYGVYSATVPGGWSGTVQPIRGDCVFTPPLREYADVQSDQIDQNYEGQCCVTSLFEAWETAIDTGTWQIWGSPAPIIRPGLGWDGSDGLDPNGDGSYASGVLSLAQYGFGPGASLSARFMSNVENVPRGNYFQVIRFGFTGPELECGGECVRDSLSISVAISQENGNGEKIMVCRGGVGTLYEEPYPPSEDAIWHHAELRMLEDGRIEYWLDGELRYTSPDPIPISSPLNVYVDGRSLGIINILDDLQLIDCSAGFTPAEPAPPASLALGQNFPNPFNPTTTIHFGLSAAGEVRLTVHDIGGRLV